MYGYPCEGAGGAGEAGGKEDLTFRIYNLH